MDELMEHDEMPLNPRVDYFDWSADWPCDKCGIESDARLTLDENRFNKWFAYYSGPCGHDDLIIRRTPEEEVRETQRVQDYYDRIGVRSRVVMIWEGINVVREDVYVEDFWRGITLFSKDNLDSKVQTGSLGWDRRYFERDNEVCFPDMTELVRAAS